MNTRKIVKQALCVILASFLMAACILAYLHAGLGSDSLTVFEEGLSKFFHTSVGNAAIMYNVSAVILALLVSRKDVGWTTVLNALCVGPFVNIVEPVLTPFCTMSTSLPFRIFLLALGLGLCCLGCAFLIYGKAGMSSLDAISTGVSERIHQQYRYVRIFFDALFLLIGWLLGGVVGVGSIVSILLTGPLIAAIAKVLNRVLPAME